MLDHCITPVGGVMSLARLVHGCQATALVADLLIGHPYTCVLLHTRSWHMRNHEQQCYNTPNQTRGCAQCLEGATVTNCWMSYVAR
eukprot:1288330-Amphidinium_carterae.1